MKVIIELPIYSYFSVLLVLLFLLFTTGDGNKYWLIMQILYSPGTVMSEGTVSQMGEYPFPIEKDTLCICLYLQVINCITHRTSYYSIFFQGL